MNTVSLSNLNELTLEEILAANEEGITFEISNGEIVGWESEDSGSNAA